MQSCSQFCEMKSVQDIGELTRDESYRNHISQISSLINIPATGDLSKDDPEYQLLLRSNELLQDIDEEIFQTYVLVANLYRSKFPELETIIPNRLDYIKVVLRMGNETDVSVLNLKDILPQATIMVLSVTASSTTGRPLSEVDVGICIRGCEEVLRLNDDKRTVSAFIESRMTKMAPNLCSLVGPEITAELVGLAGGVDALAKIPACNIQVMGQPKRNLMGLSSVSTISHAGVLSRSEIVTSAQPAFRKKVLKALAGKVALAARVDSFKGAVNGADGVKFRESIEHRVEQMQDIPSARTHKALPIPEEKKKARRGGKRVRKLKERMAMTDLRKQQNKIDISLDRGEYGDSAMGVDVVSTSGPSGRLRAVKTSQAQTQYLKKAKKVLAATSSSETGGMVSSLAFTPVQGIELVNPSAVAEKVKDANKKWFDAHSGFLSAKPK